jgi:hypothetical protein
MAEKLVKVFAFAVSFCKNLIITLVFEESANVSAENWQKFQKIVIITSTPVSVRSPSLGQPSKNEIRKQTT